MQKEELKERVDFWGKRSYSLVMYTMSEETRTLLQEAMKYTKGNPKFVPETDWRKLPRGNPYLARNRFITIEEVDARLDKMLGLK